MRCGRGAWLRDLLRWGVKGEGGIRGMTPTLADAKVEVVNVGRTEDHGGTFWDFGDDVRVAHGRVPPRRSARVGTLTRPSPLWRDTPGRVGTSGTPRARWHWGVSSRTWCPRIGHGHGRDPGDDGGASERHADRASSARGDSIRSSRLPRQDVHPSSLLLSPNRARARARVLKTRSSRQTTVPKAPRSARSADKEGPALGPFKGRVGTNNTGSVLARSGP
jgi:hypothetical protein